ncbi:hypothetical protein [Enterococcus faecalis]|uniref:hypothetical protein n=1 Tax=Enterococcus faecalis TaxID=1351 RepID=UPI001031FFA8|nr:hypothetical protein [Enterococcus faecalis]TBH17982.1 hypothetical protein EYC52_01730 [Enterococcus faecalis]
MVEKDKFRQFIKDSLVTIKNSSDEEKKITIEFFRKEAEKAPTKGTRNFYLCVVDFTIQSLTENTIGVVESNE